MLLTLSDYVLLGILLQCDDIDKVCLGLTCKKLWSTVKRYAVFNVDYFDFKGIELVKEHIGLKSLIPNIVRSLEHVHYVDDEIREIPEQATHLKFSDEYNTLIKPGQIPYGIQRVDFGRSFNQPLGSEVLPASVTTLKFGYHFNQPLVPNESLPAGLRQLTLSSLFNQPMLPGSLPAALTHLRFGLNFNQPIGPGVLPEHLVHLVFGFSMERALSEIVLPDGLKHLTLGCRFNHEIGAHALPASIETLELLSLQLPALHAGSVPPNLTRLTITCGENPLDPVVLPNSLTHLRINVSSSDHLVGLKSLPLKSLVLPKSFDQILNTSLLPDTLEHLEAGAPTLADITLPPRLVSLAIDGLTPQTIVPHTLTSLTILNTSNNIGFIPSGVSELSLCTKFVKINFNLPPQIKHLILNVTGISWKGEDVLEIPFGKVMHLDRLTINDIYNPGNRTTFYIRTISGSLLVVSDKNLYGMFIPISEKLFDLNFIKMVTTNKKENQNENLKEKEK
ncbi:hypothetical protein DFA_04676 [Cavenderia fasciculata]|uniref:F-box domain-containing protein n=1 Tax=Cavenderia fasciculata TaxID=261658 RepID=F4PQ83_CACFS|nr:uncharacterized protein DFA_04676 [Cavenderia fasciculata]EGG22546.1 hypothetical protein DFA_04676 [Cavenderia fasciculata]|eukprot:XP_004360397.1 hypothetical protein DFA_04676 [Cavenderia fasciculata]